MNASNESSACIDGQVPARYDIYAIIHKALRNFMFDTLRRVGSADHHDAPELAAALAQVRALGAFCAAHLKHENAFVHTAMEARSPGSSADLAAEHEHHLYAISRLDALASAVEQSGDAGRAAAVTALYRYLAVFAGENLLHMNVEETEHNAVLWSVYTDAELIAIEQALVASIPPPQAMDNMRWMIPAMNAEERAEKFAGIRRHAPPPVVNALMEIARATLCERDLAKLDAALAEPLAA